MLKIEILSPQVQERNSRGGSGRTFRVQKAAVFLPGEKYPVPFDLPIGKNAPYAVGEYSLMASSFRVFANMLEFRPQLTPIEQSAQRPRSATGG